MVSDLPTPLQVKRGKQVPHGAVTEPLLSLLPTHGPLRHSRSSLTSLSKHSHALCHGLTKSWTSQRCTHRSQTCCVCTNGEDNFCNINFGLWQNKSLNLNLNPWGWYVQASLSEIQCPIFLFWIKKHGFWMIYCKINVFFTLLLQLFLYQYSTFFLTFPHCHFMSISLSLSLSLSLFVSELFYPHYISIILQFCLLVITSTLFYRLFSLEIRLLSNYSEINL